MRNGLTAAAAAGGVLAVATSITTEPLTTGSLAADADPVGHSSAAVDPTAEAAVLRLAAADDPPAAADGPLRLLAAAIVPVTDTAEPDRVEVSDLLKAVGLADVARKAEEERAAREAAVRCADADLGALGRVKPWVRAAAQFLSCLYDNPDLIGVAGRANLSDHPSGLAVDLMVRGERGDLIASCALSNMDALGISYVIWKQRINYGDGWERMSDRGGETANHFDHVHVSFLPRPGAGQELAERCS